MIPDEELKVEALRRPPGGQHVGMETGVRITHLPTGLVAECKTERSQHRNRQIALEMLMGGLTSPHFRGSLPDRKGRPDTPTPETKKVAEDWYTWGFQAGMEAERKARAAHDSAQTKLRGNCWCEAYTMPEGYPHRPTCSRAI